MVCDPSDPADPAAVRRVQVQAQSEARTKVRTEAQARKERLKAALRVNLSRRKQQTRSRAAEGQLSDACLPEAPAAEATGVEGADPQAPTRAESPGGAVGQGGAPAGRAVPDGS